MDASLPAQDLNTVPNRAGEDRDFAYPVLRWGNREKLTQLSHGKWLNPHESEFPRLSAARTFQKPQVTSDALM